jgi:hypothetical protein
MLIHESSSSQDIKTAADNCPIIDLFIQPFMHEFIHPEFQN